MILLKCNNVECKSERECTKEEYIRNAGKFCGPECRDTSRSKHLARILSPHYIGRLALDLGKSKKFTYEWTKQYAKTGRRPTDDEIRQRLLEEK